MAGSNNNWGNRGLKIPKRRYSNLHDAVVAGDKNAVEQLLNEGKDVNAFNKYGATPLHLAIQNNKLEIAELLIEKESNVNATRRVGNYIDEASLLNDFFQKRKVKVTGGVTSDTPLHIAVRQGNAEAIELLLGSRAEVNESNAQDRTPLIAAMNLKDKNTAEKIAKLLIKNGANVHHIEKGSEESALTLAIRNNLSSEFIKELIQGVGQKVLNHKNARKISPIDLVFQSNRADLIDPLLNKGVKFSDADIEKASPAIKAKIFEKQVMELAKNNDQKGMESFIRKYPGVVELVKNSKGETPLHIAAENGHDLILGVLVDNGIAINSLTNDGKSVLSYALKNDVNTKVQEFLNHNLKNAPITKREYKPYELFEMVKKGKLDKISQAIDEGVDINTKNAMGNTFLHAAILKGDKEMVSKLLEKGADVNIQNNKGNTALHLAVLSGQKEMAQALKEKGADASIKNNAGRTATELEKVSSRINMQGQSGRQI